MICENAVVFKGSLDGITVILDAECAFETLIEAFQNKLISSKKFFSGAHVNMRFKGRILEKEEEEILMDVLKNQNIVNVSFVHPFETTSSTQQNEQVNWLLEELNKPNVSLTQVHYGMVRSGQCLDYKGSVIVLGDVNPGGVITADGNIIVMGTLNGRVHAGRDPKNKKPFVIATNMHPIQITIQDVIAQSPEGEKVVRNKKQLPQIAYVLNNQIYVEEIDVKTIALMVE